MNRRNIIKSSFLAGILGITGKKALASNTKRDPWDVANQVLQIGGNKTDLREGELLQPGDFFITSAVWGDGDILMKISLYEFLNVSEVLRRTRKPLSWDDVNRFSQNRIFAIDGLQHCHDTRVSKINVFPVFIASLMWKLRELLPKLEKAGKYKESIIVLKNFLRTKGIDLDSPPPYKA